MWRDIKGYEGLYEINENAVVRRVDGTGIDGRKVSTHVVVSSRTKKGTRYIALWKEGGRRTYMLHKLYATAFQMSKMRRYGDCTVALTEMGRQSTMYAGTLLESLKIYEKEQAEGLNRNDEILYIRQFLEELKTDMEEKNRYLEEVPQRMAEM